MSKELESLRLRWTIALENNGEHVVRHLGVGNADYARACLLRQAMIEFESSKETSFFGGKPLQKPWSLRSAHYARTQLVVGAPTEPASARAEVKENSKIETSAPQSHKQWSREVAESWRRVHKEPLYLPKAKQTKRSELLDSSDSCDCLCHCNRIECDLCYEDAPFGAGTPYEDAPFGAGTPNEDAPFGAATPYEDAPPPGTTVTTAPQLPASLAERNDEPGNFDILTVLEADEELDSLECASQYVAQWGRPLSLNLYKQELREDSYMMFWTNVERNVRYIGTLRAEDNAPL